MSQEPALSSVRGTLEEDVLKPLRLSIPVAMAYGPLGIALGVYMVTSGIAWYWAPLSALIIFGGSVEFLVVQFILTGVTLPVVAWTALIVNFRHCFYGLSFPLDRIRSRSRKLYGVYALTDEAYAITAAGEGRTLTDRGITILQAASQLWWVLGAALGALFGLVLPESLTGFEFALTAMFITLALDAIRHNHEGRLVSYAVMACAVGLIVEKWLLSGAFLAVSIVVYLACITVSYVTGREDCDA